MAFSNLSVADLKALKHHFQDWCRRNYRNDFSLLITGKTGVGKSSLVNALVGKKVAEEGFEIEACTKQATSYCAEVIEGIKVNVWDSPGYEEGDGKDNCEELFLTEIKQKITEKLDLVIFCLKMDDTRFYSEDKKTIKILTRAFGKELWNNAVIALTFANKVEDPAGGDKKTFFLKRLENWQKKIHSLFKNDLEIDPKILQSLPLITTGYYQQPSSLPNCENWLSTFWSACYDVAKGSAAFNLYRINRGRIRFPGCDNLASVTGEFAEETQSQSSLSTAAGPPPGGVDSKIPVIELGEKEQDSFWKKTWEMFKEHCLTASVLLGVISTVGFGVLKLLK